MLSIAHLVESRSEGGQIDLLIYCPLRIGEQIWRPLRVPNYGASCDPPPPPPPCPPTWFDGPVTVIDDPIIIQLEVESIT